MQIKDIKSSELLPRFAEQIAWIQNAFDEVCKAINLRTPAIDAPLTMESIEALTDSEIQYFFDSIGIIKYYPDINRSVQNTILYNLYKLQRYAGTPRVVELLCQYIFQDIDLSVSITDNLAFDDSGYIINPQLLDLFDVDVLPSSNILTPEIIDRIFKNIFSLSRNSQTIRDFNINYDPTNIDANAYIIAVGSVYNSINDAICEPVTPPVIAGMFGGDFSGNDITLDAVDGGGSVIDRYNPGRALFELRGWGPGGCFWDVLGNFVIMDSTTGNVISSVQIGNTDLPVEIDVLEPSEIIDPTAPEELLIGVTTECPAGTESLSSEYFWAYAFGSTYFGNTNWYDPSYYQDATPPYYQNDSTLTPVGGAKYSQVALTNGAGGTYSPNSFALSLYNSKPELYLDNGFESQSSTHNGMIVKYGSDIPTQSLNLPSDMYTISGTTITWDMSHPLMILLQGKPFEYV